MKHVHTLICAVVFLVALFVGWPLYDASASSILLSVRFLKELSPETGTYGNHAEYSCVIARDGTVTVSSAVWNPSGPSGNGMALPAVFGKALIEITAEERTEMQAELAEAFHNKSVQYRGIEDVWAKLPEKWAIYQPDQITIQAQKGETPIVLIRAVKRRSAEVNPSDASWKLIKKALLFCERYNRAAT